MPQPQGPVVAHPQRRMSDDAILQRLDGLEDKLDGIEARTAVRLDKIEEQTVRHNGRMSAIELSIKVAEALAKERSDVAAISLARRNRLFTWLPESAAPVLAVGVGWALAHFLS